MSGVGGLVVVNIIRVEGEGVPCPAGMRGVCRRALEWLGRRRRKDGGADGGTKGRKK